MRFGSTAPRDRRHAIDPEDSWIGAPVSDVPHRIDPAALTCTSTRYTLLERIGRGATSTVHRAIEHRVDGGAREVALKRLVPLLAEDADFLGAYISEAVAAASLRHPNIARIGKVGRGATGYFISRELVRGHDLRQIAARSSYLGLELPLGLVLSLLRELCDALAHAHSARHPVMHGDLTPGHLLVDSRGRLRLIDFGVGLARPSDELTRIRLARGKHGYTSPEAGRGEPPTDGSDVFVAGVLAHELLTGRRLFTGATDAEIARAVQQQPIAPPSASRRHCPRAVDDLVMRALQRRPGARFSSAAAMRTAIVSLGADELVDARPPVVARAVATLFGQRTVTHL
jgi:serine/threonine-protein kinase